MKSDAPTVDEYLAGLPDDRREAITKIRDAVNANLPAGFDERMGYGMIGWVVPHEIYPAGYHCNPKDPLPFMNLASQKNSVNLYHMGIYGSKDLLDWFVGEYSKRVKGKIDMGKGCVRFKKLDAIPFDLIGELASKITVQEWIATMESNIEGRRREREEAKTR